jgi:isoleucyl-tRNA synthetase
VPQKELKVIRQIIRAILGHLQNYNTDTTVDVDELSMMDNLMLLKTHEYVTNVTKAYEHFQLNKAYGHIIQFMGRDVADFYLDYCKPTLLAKQHSQQRKHMQFVLNELCNVIKITISPILWYIAQDMHENSPEFDILNPCVFQNEWPSVENKLSIQFLRKFTLRDKLDEMIKLRERIKIELLELQKQHKIQDGYDLDLYFEVESPDSDEAIMLDELKPHLEDLLNVS